MEVLWIGLALMLIFEGIIPFVNPGTARKMYAMILQMDDHSLRMGGLVAMSLGLILLYFVR